MSDTHITARSLGLLVCHYCAKLSKPSVTHNKNQILCCPTCGATLYYRKPDSIVRTWALLITAIIFMIPANIYPTMTVLMLGKASEATILEGVIEFVEAGMIPIALLIFIASIFVPVVKLLSLIMLLLTAQTKVNLSMQQCTQMYRMVCFIGRWSMLDLIVIAVMVTLVDLGNLASIYAGMGATAFGGVVVLTILAANSFDPRLIWDNKNARK